MTGVRSPSHRLAQAVARRVTKCEQALRVRRGQGEPGMVADLRALIVDLERLVRIRDYLKGRLRRGK